MALGVSRARRARRRLPAAREVRGRPCGARSGRRVEGDPLGDARAAPCRVPGQRQTHRKIGAGERRSGLRCRLAGDESADLAGDQSPLHSRRLAHQEQPGQEAKRADLAGVPAQELAVLVDGIVEYAGRSPRSRTIAQVTARRRPAPRLLPCKRSYGGSKRQRAEAPPSIRAGQVPQASALAEGPRQGPLENAATPPGGPLAGGGSKAQGGGHIGRSRSRDNANVASSACRRARRLSPPRGRSFGAYGDIGLRCSAGAGIAEEPTNGQQFRIASCGGER